MNKENIFSKEEEKLLLELISNEQIHMIIKDCTKYSSDKYKKLEELKVKIKDMWGEYYTMKYEDFIELGNVTLQDCIDLFEKKNRRTVINDGHIVDFIKEDENWSLKTLEK